MWPSQPLIKYCWTFRAWATLHVTEKRLLDFVKTAPNFNSLLASWGEVLMVAGTIWTTIPVSRRGINAHRTRSTRILTRAESEGRLGNAPISTNAWKEAVCQNPLKWLEHKLFSIRSPRDLHLQGKRKKLWWQGQHNLWNELIKLIQTFIITANTQTSYLQDLSDCWADGVNILLSACLLLLKVVAIMSSPESRGHHVRIGISVTSPIFFWPHSHEYLHIPCSTSGRSRTLF